MDKQLVSTSSSTIATYKQVTDQDIRSLGVLSSNRTVDTSVRILASVTASDTEEFGKKLNELIGLSKKLNPNDITKPSFLKRLFNFKSTFSESIKAQYDNVEDRMNALCLELDNMASARISRNKDLEQLYIENEEKYRSYEKDITIAKGMLDNLNFELDNYKDSGDVFDSEDKARISARINSIEKLIDDFERAKQLCVFAAPDIRTQMRHNQSLVDSVKTIKVTTIPAWKGVFSRYIVALEIKKSAALVNSVYDATDEAFKMQANQLLENTIEVSKAQHRSVISTETLEHVQKQLIASIDKAQEIEREAREARASAKPKLEQLTKDLINRYQRGN